MPSRAKKTSSRRATPARKPARPKRKTKKKATEAQVQAAIAGDRRTKLGTKYSCFSCGAKFYDLNKPEPICPRCGADQRERPVQSDAPPPQPPPPPRRPMASLLEEEESTESTESYDEDDLDLGISALGEDDSIFPEAVDAGDEDYED